MAFGGENAESYHDEGLTAMMKGDLTRAVQCFKRAAQLDSSYLAAYHQLGKCYLRLGRAERALEILGQVVANKPNLVPARLDLAYTLLSLGRTGDAGLQFQQVLAAQKSNYRAFLGLAQVSFAEGDWTDAVQHAQAARIHGGASFAVLFLLGRAARLAGNHVLAEDTLKEAEAVIEKSVELSPETPEGHFLRGEVSFAQERFSSALDHFRAASDRALPQRHYSAFGETFTRLDVLARCGFCLQRLGNRDGAREVGRQILAVDPENAAGKALAE